MFVFYIYLPVVLISKTCICEHGSAFTVSTHSKFIHTCFHMTSWHLFLNQTEDKSYLQLDLQNIVHHCKKSVGVALTCHKSKCNFTTAFINYTPFFNSGPLQSSEHPTGRIFESLKSCANITLWLWNGSSSEPVLKLSQLQNKPLLLSCKCRVCVHFFALCVAVSSALQSLY